MKKILIIMLLTFTTFAAADEGKYLMIPADEFNHSVWVLNTENGDIKQCYFKGGYGIDCTPWRKDDKDEFYIF